MSGSRSPSGLTPERREALAAVLSAGKEAIHSKLDEEPGPDNAQLIYDLGTAIAVLPERFDEDTVRKARGALERVFRGPTPRPGDKVVRKLIVEVPDSPN